MTFDFEDAEGVAVVMDATTLWLVSAADVWLSALPAFAEVEVSADVVKADVRIDQGAASSSSSWTTLTGPTLHTGLGASGRCSAARGCS